MDDRKCSNCKYENTDVKEEPCDRCSFQVVGDEFKWEPKDERRCSNCKHFFKKQYEEPCVDCLDKQGFIKWEPDEEMQIKVEKRPELLPRPFPIYEHTDSEIPERIRISFTNGTSAIYDMHTDQPAPVIIENIKIIRRMKQGYVNQPVRRRRRK